MIKVGILHPGSAFYPEIVAYKSYLSSSGGIEVADFTDVRLACAYADVLFVLCGFFPFWRIPRSNVIVEYHSLSTGRFSVWKNLIKRVFNVRGEHYVFLSEKVRKNLFFLKSVSHSTRGMGFDQNLVDKYKKSDKDFDLVYSGSTGRPGVYDAIGKIAKLGLSIAVVGNSDKDACEFSSLSNGQISFFGRVSLEESYKIMARARFGLNFTPNVYPFNIQDSTKVIEYCALGLGVVTNKYEWVTCFEKSISAKFMNLEDVSSREQFEGFQFSCGAIDGYSWDKVIERSGIERRIRNLANFG